MEQVKGRTRRRHDRELKAAVVAECSEAGASVASVAMKHGVNANLVHKWIRLARTGAVTSSRSLAGSTFVSVPLPAPVAAAEDIRIELRRGPVLLTISWPVSGAANFAAWTRELLR